jgi:hypothetical protein
MLLTYSRTVILITQLKKIEFHIQQGNASQSYLSSVYLLFTYLGDKHILHVHRK